MYKIIVWNLFVKDNEVLLLQKSNNGEWVPIGGHVEDQESLKMAVQRRSMEEVGLKIMDDNLSLVCVIDRELDDSYKLHVFFKSLKWEGEPENKESQVHSELRWYKLNSLPNNIGPLALAAIESMQSGKLYHFKDHPNQHNKH